MFTEIARGRVGSAPPTRRVARPSAPSAVRKCNESDPFISTQVEKVGQLQLLVALDERDVRATGIHGAMA